MNACHVFDKIPYMKLSPEELLEKFSNSTAHPFEVRRIAMMIFDEASDKLFCMPASDRKLLEAAAILHDIGYHIECKNHNKHSQKLVLEYGLAGFSRRETELAACICRYHRGSLPDKEKHEIYSDFDKKERKTVKRLGGILRLADGLDRAHLALIKKVKINYNSKYNIAEFLITPNTPDYYPDLTSAIRKRDLFEIGFKTQSVLKFDE